ncbi:hypothetical protein FVQ98_03915 [Ottowia sp. GY511]|uniref:YchJ family protein n=1 Tax=Ottowia flava TaxID=2675430 RepID=A0ABW4KUB8_9BURK|nr:YchJ family metal-binding protein [Ottowia sp. GY511]TXK33206.1 hypothetical protein FVQ98_03915 [Ottowia sp. GY511]
MPLRAADSCPCGRHNARRQPLTWAACCGRYVDDWTLPAPDAESLMRSRYSAFVAERADYLLATWAEPQRPAALDFDPGARWLGLEVRSHQATGAEQAEVEFVARWRVAGRAVRLHERSRFVRRADAAGVLRWWYVDGDQY